MSTIERTQSSVPSERTGADTLTVSVVIPCLNEAETIAECVGRARRTLDAAGISGEVVVADNGSDDGSAEIAVDHGARVIHEPRRGYGSAYLAKMVGQKFAREIFFLGRTYTADDMHRMGAVNIVSAHAELESDALQVAREIMSKSPQAQRMLKFAFNLTDDGLMGQQVFAGEATRLAYMTDEAVEGKNAFLEKRDPDWDDFPFYY